MLIRFLDLDCRSQVGGATAATQQTDPIDGILSLAND